MSIRPYILIASGIFILLFQPFSGSTATGFVFILVGVLWLIINARAKKQESLTTGQIREAIMSASISNDFLDNAEKALAEGDHQKAQELAKHVLNFVPDVDIFEVKTVRARAKNIISHLPTTTSPSTKKMSPKLAAQKTTSMATLIEDGNLVEKISPELAVQKVKSIAALIEGGKLIDAENQLKELMKHKVDDKANPDAGFLAITSIAACAISLKNAKKKASMDFDI